MTIADGRKINIRFTQPLIGQINESVDVPQNLDLWSFNNPDASYSNEYDNGVNTLLYTGGANFERFYIPVNVERNSTYKFSFSFCSPSGFTYGGYGALFDYAFASSADPSETTQAAEGIAKIARTRDYVISASDIPGRYDMVFNSGDSDTVYISIDFGYITDGVQASFVVSDIAMVKLANTKCFTVSFDEYNMVPEGSLSKVSRPVVDLTSDYVSIDRQVDLQSGIFDSVVVVDGALRLEEIL